MKLLLFSAALATLAFAAPKNPLKSVGDDKCGLVKFDVVARYSDKAFSDLLCPLCQDLVKVAEMYAECEEAKIQSEFDIYCEKIKNSLVRGLCLTLVNDLADEIIKDTDKDPHVLCSRLLKADCTY